MHTTRILTAVSLVLMSLAGASTYAQPADRAEARVIVKFKSQSTLLRRDMKAAERSTEQATRLGQRVGLTLRGGRHISDRSQVVKAKGLSSSALAQRLRTQSDVEYAEPDLRYFPSAAPNDPRYAASGSNPGQWYLRAPTNSARAAIDAEGAWNTTTGSSSVVVAVLDTGVRFEHPDLLRVGSGGNLLDGYDMIAPDPDTTTTTANDGNGRDADASDPGDWVTAGESSADCPESDSSWHGTRTSGLVAALTNNGTGIASVGRTVQVLPVRVLGKCGGYGSDIQAGMRWAVGLSVPGVPVNTHPAKVLNMSFGGDDPCSQSYKDAIADVAATGAVMVVAAGNEFSSDVGSPGSCPGVIAVAGLHHTGTKVDFSNLGSAVAVSAPGGDCDASPCYYIVTTSNLGSTTPGTSGYELSAGTSFSTPLVAATAALALSVAPTLTPAALRTVLQGGAREFPTTGAAAGTPACHAPDGSDQGQCYCTTATCGAGMLDARASVLFASLGVNARITLGGVSPVANQPLVIDGSTSAALGGHQVVDHQWSLTSGGGIVTVLGGTGDASKVSVTPTASGSFTVSLTVTDDQTPPVQSTTTRTITVAAAPVVITQPVADGGGGGGGGALGWPWLTGLLAGVLALQALRRWGDPTQRRL